MMGASRALLRCLGKSFLGTKTLPDLSDTSDLSDRSRHRPPKQRMHARECFRSKAHRPLQLIIALHHVCQPLTAAEVLPANRASHPRPMPQHRHRKVAPVHHARGHWFANAFCNVPAANGNVEGAVVSVKI